jgi:hypothetical protein
MMHQKDDKTQAIKLIKVIVDTFWLNFHLRSKIADYHRIT